MTHNNKTTTDETRRRMLRGSIVAAALVAGALLNDVDRLLQSVPEAQRAMLVVDFNASAEAGANQGVFDIVLNRV